MHVSAPLEAAAVLKTNLKVMHGEAVMTGQAVTIPLCQLWLTAILPDTTVSIAGCSLCLHRHRLCFSGLTVRYHTSKKLVSYSNVLFFAQRLNRVFAGPSSWRSPASRGRRVSAEGHSMNTAESGSTTEEKT